MTHAFWSSRTCWLFCMSMMQEFAQRMNMHDINELICRLTKHGFELTREGSFSEFLGIKFVHNKETGAITAMQQGLIKRNSSSDINGRLQLKLGFCCSHCTWNRSWWWTDGWGVELPINHRNASLPVDKHLPWHYICSEPSSKVQPLSQEESCNCCQDDHPLPQVNNQQGNHHSSHRHSTASWLLGWCRIWKSLLCQSGSRAFHCQVTHWIHHHPGRLSSCVEVPASINHHPQHSRRGTLHSKSSHVHPHSHLHHLDWDFICFESSTLNDSIHLLLGVWGQQWHPSPCCQPMHHILHQALLEPVVFLLEPCQGWRHRSAPCWHWPARCRLHDQRFASSTVWE